MRLMSVLEPFLKLGRRGGVILILAGLAVLGLLELDIGGGWWGITIVLGALLLLGGLFRLLLRTADDRIAELVDEDAPPGYEPITAAQVRTLALPLYICTDCCVRLDTDVMCLKCDKSAWCMSVESDEDRRLALAAME